MNDICDEVSLNVLIAWWIKERQSEVIINMKTVSQISQNLKTSVTFEDAHESHIMIWVSLIKESLILIFIQDRMLCLTRFSEFDTQMIVNILMLSLKPVIEQDFEQEVWQSSVMFSLFTYLRLTLSLFVWLTHSKYSILVWI